MTSRPGAQPPFPVDGGRVWLRRAAGRRNTGPAAALFCSQATAGVSHEARGAGTPHTAPPR